MKLCHLTLTGFATYSKLVRDFSPGLTLIVGDNGAGKSTLGVEGPSWALYGQTVREAFPWAGKVMSARLVFDHDGETYAVERRRDKGNPEVKLSCGMLDLSAQTATETQTKIDRMIGTWDHHVSTRIFARSFLTRFGGATDKERKALLEALLGLGQFDRALDLVRADLRVAEDAKIRMAGNATSLGAILDRVLQGRPPEGDDPESIRARVEALRLAVTTLEGQSTQLASMADSAVSDLQGASGGLAELRRAAQLARQRVIDLAARRDRNLAGDTCPACLRPLVGRGRNEALDHYTDELSRLEKARVAAEMALAPAEDEYAELRGEADTLREKARAADAKVAPLRSDLAMADRLLARAEASAAEMARWQTLHDQTESDHVAAKKATEAARGHAERLSAVEDVFGLRGARVALLTRALARLEAETNVVLGKLGLGMRVGIAGQATQKSGKVVDAIAIRVDGAGGGDYRACSDGERARLDVALLLALAALSGAGGVLVFDEVFDALDRDGIERVAAFLGELAQTRQIVVITHHADLLALFPASVVWRVSKDDFSLVEAA
jgi:exonuclease SbcC